MDVKQAGAKGGQTTSKRKNKEWYSKNGQRAAQIRWAKKKQAV